MAMLIFLFGVGLASIAAVSSEAFIEAQDPSMKIDDAPETNVKRWHNGCSRRCYYYRCPNGYYCDGYRCCRPNNQRPCSHNAHCPQDGAVSQGDVKRKYPVPRPAAVLPHSVVISFGRWLEGGAIIGVY
ncbi:hypothetical protein OS493_034799 [Desmophyllum pertusum]|uniref:Uncharacterized protein n=1 Tax=Desmophyllum pertusum TaxID=174260 RepID=A0A9W9YIK9_9CNID|nr:hypothetical protein OS493_034799 [Desmophyllum pertusum]